MADPQKDQKTEKPTARRKQQHRREGKVARSRDVPVALSLIAALILVRYIGPMIFETMLRGTRSFLVGSQKGLEAPAITEELPRMILVGIGPMLALAMIMGVVANLAQVGFVFSPQAVKPKMSKVSPKNGMARFKPKKMLWETSHLILKIGLLVLVLVGPIREATGYVESARGLNEWLLLINDSLRTLLSRAAALAVIIAGADFIYNKRETMSQMKMSKQEIKDESKQQEGDPMLRGMRRSKARELSRNRMISTVAEADVVLVNPIRLAVALRYTDGDPAPIVVAKGMGVMARRIRAEAYRNGVSVRQDKPLARALFRRCRVGQQIPPELYEAVAVILAAVMRQRTRKRRPALVAS
ncbi:MAG: EscU/YscU/HrcU family type III secretion system export apparatus switch protein [Actinomycetia bacterium]|nr:EscU/YscU/HrcU family type III secretion system export apparatus switch protein [Actinomycetes bacterium]MCP4960856.1 EscU/YscU/HrcU family type III secretion system export apparatus switch protein [Actinomycetes bacterium]